MPQEWRFFHNTFDAFPLSIQKIKSIYALSSDKAEQEEILLPFSLYHSRWDELTWQDIMNAFNRDVKYTTKGSEYGFSVYSGAEDIQIEYTT